MPRAGLAPSLSEEGPLAVAVDVGLVQKHLCSGGVKADLCRNV